VNAFRREMLRETGLGPGVTGDAAFIASRQASAGLLLVALAGAYPALLRRYRSDGPSQDLLETTCACAGDLATVLQSWRSREDLVAALEQADGALAPPLTVLDQLFHSFVLLTGGASAEELAACLTAEQLAELMASRRVREWLQWLDAERLLAPSGDEAPPEG
jgi:hypothetical protein